MFAEGDFFYSLWSTWKFNFVSGTIYILHVGGTLTLLVISSIISSNQFTNIIAKIKGKIWFGK